MKKILALLWLSSSLALNASAQQAKEEIEQNVFLSASNYLAYPGPSQLKLTPAPKGYKPFYISHYGRHGSRYHIGNKKYNYPVDVLESADKENKLSEKGKDVLRRLRLIRNEAYNRYGELTELGAEQHKQIAKRMFERFPEVFEGNVTIDAKSTIVIRCILSMENELQQFLLLNPKLSVRHDASEHDMYYMNQSDDKLYQKKMPYRSSVVYKDFCNRHACYERVVNQLFSDTAYVKYNVDAEKLNDYLFSLASNLQSSELGKEITLYDLFTKNELYQNWLQHNAYWYLTYGNCKLNGGTQPFSQRNLLRNIIHQADSCILLSRPGATLRFGHETMVLPLTCLLGLNNFDQQVDDLEQLENKGWINYKVFPMGANIQFVFYRKSAGGDVLVKVLLNENEATLPFESVTGPYYHWNDFKNYYLKKLDSYTE